MARRRKAIKGKSGAKYTKHYFGTFIPTQASALFVDRSCGKKKNYKNKKVAGVKAQEARDRTGDNIHEYKCGLGRHWHIGHKTPKTKLNLQHHEA